MRRVTFPPETFSHSSPISCRTRCHDDPSGARVAILTTTGPACAGTLKGNRKRRAAPQAAALFQKELIYPPCQPSRLALREKIGKTELRGLPPGVEAERPVEQTEELRPVLRSDRHGLREGDHRGDPPPRGKLHRPFVVTLRPLHRPSHRFGTPPLEGDVVLVDRPRVVPLLELQRPAHQRLAPGKIRQQHRVVRGRCYREAPRCAGPEQEGDILLPCHGDGSRGVGREPLPESRPRRRKPPEPVLLRPQEEAAGPLFPRLGRPAVLLLHSLLPHEGGSVLGESLAERQQQSPVIGIPGEENFLRLE